MKICGICHDGDMQGKKFTGKVKIRKWLGVGDLCEECKAKHDEEFKLKSKNSFGGIGTGVGAKNRIKNHRTADN
ncbi:MAG: hypothetical protein V4547_18260 [Bacteroidota bacterium]